ncbi:carotenoid oxygenase family protein [Thalassotalea ganghwensis]
MNKFTENDQWQHRCSFKMSATRRQLLKGLGVASLTTALPLSFSALAKGQVGGNLAAFNVKALFNEALAKRPELIGFANVEQNLSADSLSIEGRIPLDLQGQFLRNGPAKHERNNIRYKHVFEGDGMVQRFEIAQGRVSHIGRFIETPKYTKEQAAGKFLYSGPDTKIANAKAVTHPNVINTANTNIINVGNDLWALWEEGAASRLDSQTLDYKEQINLGAKGKYGNTLKGLPFSAHPKVDSNGDIWNFGLDKSGHVVVYHLSALGSVKNAGIVRANYKGLMLHDFLITHRHVLLILPSLVSDKTTPGHFTSIGFDKNLPMTVLVVDKNDLTVKKRLELPPGFAFHFGNAWEEADGTIHFDGSLYDNVDILHQLSDVMSGKEKPSTTYGQATLFSLYSNGAIKSHVFKGKSEFPRISAHLTGRKNRYLYHLSTQADSIWDDTIRAIDLHTGKLDSYFYGEDFLVEEHVPYNPKGVEGQGYLIGTALHVPSKRTCLNIFDLSGLSQGPIARAWLPYHLPLGFHGNFIAS